MSCTNDLGLVSVRLIVRCIPLGVGRATAIALNRAGWSVVVFARRKPELEETRTLCPTPDKVAYFVGDVTSEKSVQELFEFAVKTFSTSLPVTCLAT